MPELEQQQPTHLATIEKLVYGGEALLRNAEGQAVFVSGALAGETVEWISLGKQKGRLQGSISKIVTPSPERREPVCPVFARCGGCKWQHMSLAEQQRWKVAITKETLQRLGGLANPPIEAAYELAESWQLSAPAQGWHYRNHVQWKVRPTTEQDSPKRYDLGYFEAGSHALVPSPSCAILQEALETLKNWLERFLPPDLAIQAITARCNHQQEIMLHFKGKQLEAALKRFIPALRNAFPKLIGVMLSEEAKLKTTKSRVLWGQPSFKDKLGNSTFFVDVPSFFQVNPAVTETLLDRLNQELREQFHEPVHVLDLYSGVGTLGLSLAKDRVASLTLVEAQKEAQRLARQNAGLHPLQEKIHCVDLKAEESLSQLPCKPQLTLLDPPRRGCSTEVIDWVASNTTDCCVYISCNPSTLARDLKYWLNTFPEWQLKKVLIFDMFPQTYHVETMNVLIKK